MKEYLEQITKEFNLSKIQQLTNDNYICSNEVYIGINQDSKRTLFIKFFEEQSMSKFFLEDFIIKTFYSDRYIKSFHNKSSGYIISDFLNNLTIQKINLYNDDHIIKMSQCISEFHKLINQIILLDRNHLFVEIYNLADTIDNKINNLNLGQYKNIILNIWHELSKHKNEINTEYYTLPKVLVHGDLSYHKIHFCSHQIFLLDFEFTHIATPLEDFIKLFYFEMNDSQIKIFMNEYKKNNKWQKVSINLWKTILLKTLINNINYALNNDLYHILIFVDKLIKIINEEKEYYFINEF